MVGKTVKTSSRIATVVKWGGNGSATRMKELSRFGRAPQTGKKGATTAKRKATGHGDSGELDVGGPSILSVVPSLPLGLAAAAPTTVSIDIKLDVEGTSEDHYYALSVTPVTTVPTAGGSISVRSMLRSASIHRAQINDVVSLSVTTPFVFIGGYAFRTGTAIDSQVGAVGGFWELSSRTFVGLPADAFAPTTASSARLS